MRRVSEIQFVKNMKKKLLALVINIMAMSLFLALVVYGVFVGIDNYTHHGEAIIVPDVKGKSVAEAQATFDKFGLRSIVRDSIYIREVKPGSVYDYAPSAGKRVKQGRIIYLTINTTNIPLYPIPDVADNSSVREARESLRLAGFKLTKDELVSGQKDWVYNVKYNGTIMEPQAQVPIGATLTLLVGDGTEIVNDTIYDGIDSLDFEKYPDELENSWFQ